MEENTVQLYMNTWGNYNENGGDATAIGGGWMSLDDALKFTQEHSEEEPFINDIDSDIKLPFEVGEYSAIVPTIERIQDFLDLTDDARIIISAIMEAASADYEEAKDIYDNGSYVWYEGATDEGALAQAVVDETGWQSVVDGLTIENYLDIDYIKEQYEDDVRHELASEMDVYDIDAITDEQLDERLDDIITDLIDGITAEPKIYSSFLDMYFDFDSYGSDLAYDYTFTDDGAILVL